MWLALETATDRASVAVGESVADAVEESMVGARRHAGALLPMVQRALARRRASLGRITGLLLSDGPGSFTGLRVGASVAKALVHARGLPLRVAPSLMVRAAGAAPPDGSLVVTVADALRGEVYAGAFRFAPDEVIVELPPAVRRPAELTRLGLTPAHLVGDVPEGIAAELERWAGRPLLRSPGGAARAVSLIALAARAGGTRLVTDVTGWEPDYGRPAEAQARWESVHGRPLPDPAGGPR
jgi:tRNA threonylcarbamoyladenosine biosynthesis protein TsaB